jgi:hypothetical protein
MVLRKRFVVMALIIAAAPAWGEPDRAANSVDRSSPEGVFAAYKNAVNGRNWKALFSLKTTEAQNREIEQVAVGVAVSEADPNNPNELRTYREIAAKHGIDWQDVKKLVSKAEASGDKDAFSKDDFQLPMRRIVERVADKPELFAEVQEFYAKIGQPVSVTVHRLEKLVRNGDTAEGESIATRRLIATVTNDTGETQRVIQDFDGRSSIRFRNVNGKWFLD